MEASIFKLQNLLFPIQRKLSAWAAISQESNPRQYF